MRAPFGDLYLTPIKGSEQDDLLRGGPLLDEQTFINYW